VNVYHFLYSLTYVCKTRNKFFNAENDKFFYAKNDKFFDV
jgi:hypothetical protein